jgi:hypothetical protein
MAFGLIPKMASTTTDASPTLLDVVIHYDSCKSLGLNAAEKSDLLQFLGSLPNNGHEHDPGDRD